MRYTPRELKENINISARSPLKELATLLISILAILLILYIVLGFMVDTIAPKLPSSIEQRLGKFYKPMYINRIVNEAAEEKMQKLLNSLTEKLPDQREYKVYIITTDEVNALALPGGTILVFSGLLKEIDSENELAFVLAHELGHFAHKDHLRALGRRMVLFALSSMLIGQDSTVSDFLGNSLSKMEMKFSQRQERNADLFALNLLDQKYNHVAGAIEFLEKMEEKRKVPKFLYFFATHPHPANRIKAVKEKIAIKGYSIQETLPLDNSLKIILPEKPTP